MKKKFGIIAVLVIALGAVFGGIFGKFPAPTSADTSITPQKIVSDYREAIEVINQNYGGSIDHEKVTKSSIQSMLWSLDPHSGFFTREEFRKLYEEQASQFYGIGVSILQRRDGVYVQSVIPGTPADKAGVHYGDKFLEVDGKDAKDWTSAEVSRNVRGERGTTVNVKFERVGSAKPVEMSIVRGGVPLTSIRNYFMLKDGVGYVGLTGGFQETTAEELDQAIADLKRQGMKSLVLDLRNNPGGLLNQATEVVSRFVERGQTVVSVKGRSRYAKSQELRAMGGKTENIPLVVMINRGSASASEIVAGAVQDYGRGIVVGTGSFGKGLVQRVFPLPYGTGLTLTTARYYTPYGRSLQKDYSSGSIYDYYTQFDEETGEATTEEKPQPKGEPVKTAGGRIFYGGRGIEPDVDVAGLAFTPLRYRVGEAAFFFTRQLIAGKVPGFESFKTEKQTFNLTVQPNEIQISDKLIEAFRNFAVKTKQNGLTLESFNQEIGYAKSRLRAELATATHSTEAGQQVLLETDPQILRAIESMPEAKTLLEKNLASK
ncbi:MAG TPA: S41 family peptidase [Pyrinomonadaceae bacterium]|nr:S41 family peptidase [Pyrinomonadaceae bacterium]